ncbi:MAG: hypothetical protein P8129_02035 [Anaerolineae bacterium]
MLNHLDDRMLKVMMIILVLLICLGSVCFGAILVNQFVGRSVTPTAESARKSTPALPALASQPTNTATSTPTPTSTSTPVLMPTQAPTLTWTPTTTATLAATDIATATATLAPPTPTQEPPPSEPNVAPESFPYEYTSAAARGDCTGTWVHGYVLKANGSPEPGVQMRVGDNQGWYTDVWSDDDGYYEAVFEAAPKAGRWFVYVFKGGKARSMQFWWDTSASCQQPNSLQEVEIIWRHR